MVNQRLRLLYCSEALLYKPIVSLLKHEHVPGLIKD